VSGSVADPIGDAPLRDPGTEPEPSPYRRLLRALRISAWSAAALGVLVATGILVFLYRGDPDGAARVANREIDFLLERGERVEQRVAVMRRHWWDFYRITHGVLAATNRRLVYVGVPPDPLLRREPEPVELEEESWTYGEPLDIERPRALLRGRTGVTVSAGPRLGRFAVSRRNVGRLDTALEVTRQRRAALVATQEAERRAVEVAAAAARRPIFHRVLAGETLETIAARFGTTVDSLRSWNAMSGDRIRAGDRLLVKPGR
jgi:hypothetical protein